MAFGYTVALLTPEDAQILRSIPERVRANYKAMDANDTAVLDNCRACSEAGYIPAERVVETLVRS